MILRLKYHISEVFYDLGVLNNIVCGCLPELQTHVGLFAICTGDDTMKKC